MIISKSIKYVALVHIILTYIKENVINYKSYKARLETLGWAINCPHYFWKNPFARAIIARTQNIHWKAWSVCPSVRLSVHSSIRQSFCQSVSPSVNPPVCPSACRAPYLWKSWFLVHLCKVIISRRFFSFFQNCDSLVCLGRVAGHNRVKNGSKWQKILSVVLHISGTVHHIWWSFVVHKCKMIISPVFFFYFFLFFILLGGSKGKKWLKREKTWSFFFYSLFYVDSHNLQ